MDDLHNIDEYDNKDENENNNMQYLSNHVPSFSPIKDDTPDDVISTTDSSEQDLFIGIEISNEIPLEYGHVILNQACTLLSRHDKEIRPYKNKNKYSTYCFNSYKIINTFYISKIHAFPTKVQVFGCIILCICWFFSCRLTVSCSFLFWF